MTKAGVTFNVSKYELDKVRDLKNFHDHTIDKMVQRFAPVIKKKMTLTSSDIDSGVFAGGGALEVKAEVVILSTKEYKDMQDEIKLLKQMANKENHKSDFDQWEQDRYNRMTPEEQRGYWGIFG
jgi:hypothetical protein